MKKEDVYCEVLDMFAQFFDPHLQGQIAKHPKRQFELGKEMAKVGMRLGIIGSDDVVKKYVKFRLIAQTEPGGGFEKVLQAFLGVMMAMREDLLPVKPQIIRLTTCTTEHLLGTFLAGEKMGR